MNLSSWSIENYLANYYAFNTLSLEEMVAKYNNYTSFTKNSNHNIFSGSNLNMLSSGSGTSNTGLVSYTGNYNSLSISNFNCGNSVNSIDFKSGNKLELLKKGNLLFF